jgi:hypothetical protein
MHEQIFFFNDFSQRNWTILDLNRRPRPCSKFLHLCYYPIGRKSIYFLFFRSDSSFPNATYNSLLYCTFQVCLFPLPFPRYMNGKFWEKKKRRYGTILAQP